MRNSHAFVMRVHKLFFFGFCFQCIDFNKKLILSFTNHFPGAKTKYEWIKIKIQNDVYRLKFEMTQKST